jgi:hypothetical protein
MRVTPRVWIGLAIYLGYCAVIVIVTNLGGVPFPEIGKSAETTLKGAVLPLGVAAVLLVITTTALGWWRPALFERQRSQHRWPIIAPVVMAIAAVLNLFNTDWSKFDAAFLMSLLALGVLVGFSEELMSRGLLLTSLRSSVREGWVWFISSALFGLMHMLNVLTGGVFQDTIGQAGLAFASGTAFYIMRRVTGSLIWAMVLHGLWDVSVFSVGFAPKELSFAPLLVFLVAALSLASVYWVIKGANEKPGLLPTAAAAVPA